ncbi:MAG: hypothetical protein E3J94_02900 [Desulfobacteraceae bacterium]|nr:MAG: hypothetical protein E3J94_02900 [Desulfobacteraceae bacterium]
MGGGSILNYHNWINLLLPFSNTEVRGYRDTNDVWHEWVDGTNKKYYKKDVTGTSFSIGTKEWDIHGSKYYSWTPYNKIGEVTDTVPTNYQF